jgi:diaminopimelate epimerase
MKLDFSKYHGAGNDFILIDNRKNEIQLTNKQINFLCNRHLGIGADGLMILNSHPTFDFKMQYFNSDGFEGSMCGNGGRCITAFAADLGIIQNEAHFIAVDGEHKSWINTKLSVGNYDISLKMIDVNWIEKDDLFYFVNTGSPHYVALRTNIDKIDMELEGKNIRYSDRFAPGGTNVNFIELKDNIIYIRTYERGVEAETLACGTGATAAALCLAVEQNLFNGELHINALGGTLRVRFQRLTNSFSNIILSGPAQLVFKGILEL